MGCPITSIYRFIKTKGYKGKYTILRQYCKSIELYEKTKATLRFETIPGLQAQVDWKEQLTLISKNSESFTINIF